MSEYSTEIRERFFHPKHVDTNAQYPEFREVSHSIGSRQQGVQIKLHVWLNAKNTIEYAKFKVYGDPIVIAACDYVCEQLMQNKVAINIADMAEKLMIPKLQQDKLIWVERAFLGVINDCNR